MLGSTCRALRQYDAADAGALRLALARALVEDETGPLLGLDTSSARRRLERLAHVLGPVLAGKDPAPAAAPKAKVSLDDVEAAFEADRPAPDADAIAHGVLRRWLFEHRSAGVEAVRSLVRGRSIEEIAAAWPGGSRAFLQASLGRSR